MRKKAYQYQHGKPYPLGSTLCERGVNFSIFTRHATNVELLLFTSATSKIPFQIIKLFSDTNRTFYSWHVFVVGLTVGTWYCWRIDGPTEPHQAGLFFNKDKILIDPLARIVSDNLWKRSTALTTAGDNCETSMRCAVYNCHDYDWEGDTPLHINSRDSIIYELHIGGYTNHHSAKVQNPGTFLGLIEKIPYLQKLGITHVELLPIMAFDRQDVPENTAALGLQNYWGYSTHSFFSPHPGYCVSPEKGTHINEFRDLVKALHKANIGIILDVVFNHTCESGAGGPIINFKGLGENIYYHHNTDDKSIFKDFTGCGNTINANHPVMISFITKCLEYWVTEMHVDGFRFDLASALTRGEYGAILENPPVLWSIELSNTLAQTKLIAEAWDATGLYQVGNFPGYRWSEWNGKYRDIVREVLRGDKGKIQELATRILGSSDLYEHKNGLSTNSINFITCHDGFTLHDLFSYNQKHNYANGEENQDGCNNNISSNCGIEGKTDNKDILNFRKKQAKNAYAILLLSQGIPMLLAGDELQNSQSGNNNVYCQNNKIAWINWKISAENAEMLHFVQNIIALRKRHDSITRKRFLTGNFIKERGLKDINWHGIKINQPLWGDCETRLLAFTLAGITTKEADLHVIINMSDQQHQVELPKIKDKTWFVCVDTSKDYPKDIICQSECKPITSKTVLVDEKTVMVLENF